MGMPSGVTIVHLAQRTCEYSSDSGSPSELQYPNPVFPTKNSDFHQKKIGSSVSHRPVQYPTWFANARLATVKVCIRPLVGIKCTDTTLAKLEDESRMKSTDTTLAKLEDESWMVHAVTPLAKFLDQQDHYICIIGIILYLLIIPCSGQTASSANRKAA